MTTAIAMYDGFERDPLKAVDELGTAIAKSRMFGCESVDQGKVFALECLARRVPPLRMAEQYHVVQGKLMMKYDAMLAVFNDRGGKHKIISRTPDHAEIELTYEGQTIRESLTWEEAQQEKYPYGKDGKIKDNWSTPRSRRQMLWARVVSEGVRSLCPGVNNGRYASEEFDVNSEGNGEVNGSANGRPATKPDDAIDAEYTVASETETAVVGNEETASTPHEKTDPAGNSPCTDDQRSEITRLFSACGATPEQQQAILQKRNCSVIRNLTTEQAAELIIGLQSRINAQAENLTGTPAPESNNPMESRSVKAPASEVTVNEVYRLLNARQDQSLVNRLVEFLHQLGKQKVNQLSQRDAEALIIALSKSDMESFFTRSLEQFGVEDGNEASGNANREPAKN